MRDYRIYYLDRTGRITRREPLRAENDERAIALLEDARQEHAIELWEQGRLVLKTKRD